MTVRSHLIRSMNHSLILMSAILMMVICWFFLRLPSANLMIVTCAMLCSSVAYDVKGWKNRLALISQIVFWASLLQFTIGICAPGKFFILIFPGIISYLILILLKNRAGACVAVVIGHLAFQAAPGFLAASNRSIELLFSLFSAFVATSYVALIHLPSDYNPAFSGAFNKIEALKITLMLVLGTFLMNALQLAEGIWIVLTVAFIYMSAGKRDPLSLGKIRIFATLFGLYMGFLYLGCLTYFNSNMIYLIPLLAAFGFFIQYYTGNYFIFSLFFLMSFTLYADFNTPQNQNVHLLQLILSRTLATTIGVILIVLFEKYFLPHKVRSAQDLEVTA